MMYEEQGEGINLRGSFDTGVLMSRLEKSATLVRSIREFLQP